MLSLVVLSEPVERSKACPELIEESAHIKLPSPAASMHASALSDVEKGNDTEASPLN